jgi:hypothetical protein
VRFEADCLGSARRENVERGIGRMGSTAGLRLARVRATWPNELGSNKAPYVERWKAVGDLLGGPSLIADELEHSSISVFHDPTVQALSRSRARTTRRLRYQPPRCTSGVCDLAS